MRFTIMTLKLDTFNQNFDAADSQDGASDTNKPVDKMGLYLTERIDLIVVVKSYNYEPLILFIA
jgi:hypothetical protein